MLSEVIGVYLQNFPEEQSTLEPLLNQVAAGEALNDRKNFNGHIAGDGIVLSPDRQRLLMVHHKFFGFWLQPGGHWDPEDANPLVGAAREVNEETGLSDFQTIEWLKGKPLVPLDIDVHHIPENTKKQEASHRHYSFAYVFQAMSTELAHQEAEVTAAEWWPITEVEKMEKWHYPRVINKLRRFKLL